MPLHKDESARDTTLFRHFLTKMTFVTAKSSPRFNGRTRLSFRKQLKDSFIFPAPPTHTTRRLSEQAKKYYLFPSQFSHTNILSLFVHFVNSFMKKHSIQSPNMP